MPEDTPDPYFAKPEGLSSEASNLWDETLADLAADDLEPTPAEYRVLADAVRTATLADSLADAIEADGGYTVPGGRGAPRPHPLLIERDRAVRTTAALLRQLSTGSRTEAAKKAAAARWRR